jgi:2Fe-2S ferredoxin
MLDFGIAVHDNSRLACQIRLTDDLDGLELTLAPESL